MGIIVNDGRRMPTYRFTRLDFARDTPYETTLEQSGAAPLQVMAVDVARMLRKYLADVVDGGTAKRIAQTFVVAGGKTGTGDNRIVTSQASGQKISSRARSRTATFVFYLGDHYFGTISAFVTGNTAASYSFTSALPLQVLKSMAPILLPR